MADPIAVISLVEGSIGLVLQCGSVAKTLSDMITKFKHAEVAITSMIQEVETIQFAWNRIKEWSEEHAEDATDSSFVQRLEKSLQCGTLVLSALEQDLANYKHTADVSSFILRSKMAWNERAFLDHQHRVRGQVQAMTLMLQVSQLTTPKARTKLLNKEEKALSASDESAYSIVPSRLSSRISVSTRSRDSLSSIESKELVYYPLSFEDDLFTARVYKRNYRSPWVNNISNLYRGKSTAEKRVPGAELKIREKGPLWPPSSTGMTKSTDISVRFSQPLRSIQDVPLRELRAVPTGAALTTESGPTDRSVTTPDPIPPTSERGSSIGSGLQNGARDPFINKLYPAGHADVLGVIDTASRHIPQIDKSRVAVARPPPAQEAQDEFNGPLLLAVESGNLDDVTTLIHQGAQVNPHNGRDRPPLHLAVCKRDVMITEFLLQNGANHTKKWYGTPPIHIACIAGNLKIMKLLLDAGASTDSLDAEQEHPLHRVVTMASHHFNAYVNARTGKDRTALHLFCELTDPENVRLLLIHGADPNSICEGGSTALHILAKSVAPLSRDRDAVFRLLYDYGADVNAKDEIGDTPLHVFAKPSFVSVSVRGDAYAIFFEFLISHGANVNAQNNAGDTPLHVLVCQPVYSMRDWTEIKATIQLLLQHGADFNTRNKAGNTPLHTFVARFSNRPYGEIDYEVTKLLLEHGADVNIQNKAGDTPLHTIVKQGLGEGRIFQSLIDHGADVGIQNNAGDTPLYIVAR